MIYTHINQKGMTKEEYQSAVKCVCPIHGGITGNQLYVWQIQIPNRKPYFKAQCKACHGERRIQPWAVIL